MATSEPQVWDEAQCSAALAQLERLQAQLDDLRLTIPRAVQPFYSPPTPTMFRSFKDNLATSQNDMKEFRNKWKSPEMQTIFAYSKTSLEANEDLSKSADVPKYGWVEVEEKGRDVAKDGDIANERESDKGFELSQEDVKKIVDEWRADNEKIQYREIDGYSDFEISFVSNSTKLKFNVTIRQESDGLQQLHASCLGTQESALAITRCLNARPQKNDLRYLLDMITAYKTVKGTTCTKCSKMFDSQLLGTVARRTRGAVLDEKTKLEWGAFHEHCEE